MVDRAAICMDISSVGIDAWPCPRQVNQSSTSPHAAPAATTQAEVPTPFVPYSKSAARAHLPESYNDVNTIFAVC